jgi:hypothetical protein
MAPAATTIQSSNIIAIQRRRRAGMPIKSSPARIAPPLPRSNSLSRAGASGAEVDAAVVCTVSTVDAVPPATMFKVVGFRLHVGKLTAPVGELASVQLIFMVPE